MIVCPSVTRESIRAHYDLTTPFYRLLWGPHIHHGLWDLGARPSGSWGDVTSAQRRLVDVLSQAARVRPTDRVLDVGCGMGGSALELGRRGCRVTGLTLSPVQQAWASWSARWVGLGPTVDIRRADAEAVRFAAATFDVVWNIECSEHFFDKPGFFRRAAGWLRPGGRMAVCAWLDGGTGDPAGEARAVCEGFLCPSLGSAADYLGWFAAAGLKNGGWRDLTDQVADTWAVCRERVASTRLGVLAPLFGSEMARFVGRFSALLSAYRSGAMRYGLFTAEGPG